MKIRLSRKLVLIIAGVLVLSGTPAAFALYMGQKALMKQVEGAPPASGLACATVEIVKVRRGGQRWIRKYVKTETTDGVSRVRTALRIAGLLVKQEQADLYQVAVLDASGPTDRAGRRGAAIGAQVLFAPDPAKVPGMTDRFVADYVDAPANQAGLFYGQRIRLSESEVQTTLTAMFDKADCAAPTNATVEEAHGSEGEAHAGKPSGHEEAPDHGAPEDADSGKVDAGHAAPEEAKGTTGEHAQAEAAGHEAEAPASGGLLASLKGMIFGSGKETSAEQPAEKRDDHAEAPAEEPAEPHKAPEH